MTGDAENVAPVPARTTPEPRVSSALELFLREAPAHAQTWMGCVQGVSQASGLEAKTRHLAGHAATQCLPAALEAYDAP